MVWCCGRGERERERGGVEPFLKNFFDGSRSGASLLVLHHSLHHKLREESGSSCDQANRASGAKRSPAMVDSGADIAAFRERSGV